MASLGGPWCRIATAGFVFVNLIAFGSATFNCTRIGTGCSNGGICDPASGACTCVGTTFTGYDCSRQEQYLMRGACLVNNPCQHGGVCYDMALPASPGVAMCYCPYEFYGEFCQLATVYNECYQDQMVVNVNPGSNFAGVVGIQHKAGFCDIMPVTAQREYAVDPVRKVWQGYAAVLYFSGGMCGDGPTVNTTATEITYTYDVIIRYDAAGSTPQLDEIISFSCPVQNQAAPAGSNAVLFSVTDPQGNFVQQPRVGSPFNVTFDVDPNSIFKDVSVRACTVFNAKRTNYRVVVKDGCPVWPFGQSLVKQGGKHVLTMMAHTLGVDPQLNFQCAVKVCIVSDPTCQQQPFCPEPKAPSALGGPGAAIGASDPLAEILRTAKPSLNIFQGFGSGSPASLLDTLLPPTGAGTGPGPGASPNGASSSSSTSFNLNDMLNMLGTGPGGTVPTDILSGGLTDIFGPGAAPTGTAPAPPPPAAAAPPSPSSAASSSGGVPAAVPPTSSTSSGASSSGAGPVTDLMSLLGAGAGASMSDIFMALGGGGLPSGGGAATGPVRRRREADSGSRIVLVSSFLH